MTSTHSRCSSLGVPAVAMAPTHPKNGKNAHFWAVRAKTSWLRSFTTYMHTLRRLSSNLITIKKSVIMKQLFNIISDNFSFCKACF